MKDMARLAHKRGVNRKLTNATKGVRTGLNRIEVPIFEWYYSEETREIYRYDSGVFEAYAPYTPQTALRPTHPTIFYNHHHLKVIPNDAVRAEVERDDDHLRLKRKYPPSTIWREEINAKEIE